MENFPRHVYLVLRANFDILHESGALSLSFYVSLSASQRYFFLEIFFDKEKVPNHWEFREFIIATQISTKIDL